MDYAGPVREIVKALKYHHDIGVVPWMADWMAGCVYANWPDKRFDVIVPVPLHPLREIERGYNQAALLAQALSKRIGTPAEPKLLRRNHWTATQTKLSARERRKNLAEAFSVRPDFRDAVPGKRFLLVDDVMTTGSTLNAASTALRRAGAGNVAALSFARG